MKRFHLFEFEDQPWFPSVFRDCMTDVLGFSMSKFKWYEPAALIIKKVVEATNISRIVDIGSGSGGPWAHLYDRLRNENTNVSVILSDKYPSTAIKKSLIGKPSGRNIEYMGTPVDASNIPRDLWGIRTVFSAFHHFDRKTAKNILREASDQHVPVCVFEFTERRIGTIFLTLFTPLIVMIITPFIRPLAFRRMFWTYLIPIVPVVMLWDAIVSSLRTYTQEELIGIARDIEGDGYVWESGQAVPDNVKFMRITYLIGYPLKERITARSESGDGSWQREKHA